MGFDPVASTISGDALTDQGCEAEFVVFRSDQFDRSGETLRAVVTAAIPTATNTSGSPFVRSASTPGQYTRRSCAASVCAFAHHRAATLDGMHREERRVDIGTGHGRKRASFGSKIEM